MLVGLDLDNTIIRYDALFIRLAKTYGLLDSETLRTLSGKKGVRDAIWERHGNLAWQRLQADAYGPGIVEAELMDGVKEFLVACSAASMSLAVVSHKTRFAAAERDQTCDLRRAAMEFLSGQGLFADGLLFREQVFFESTRQDKLARIKALGCTHFVDDMTEILEDPGFPKGVVRLLYAPAETGGHRHGIHVCTSWDRVADVVFNH